MACPITDGGHKNENKKKQAWNKKYGVLNNPYFLFQACFFCFHFWKYQLQSLTHKTSVWLAGTDAVRAH